MRTLMTATLLVAAAGLVCLGCARQTDCKDPHDLKAQIADLTEKLAKSEAERQALEQRQKELAKKRMETLKKLKAEFEDLIAAGKLKLKIKNNRIVIEMPTAVLFKSGSVEISEAGKATLTEVAEVLATIKSRSFMIAGHTDNQPKKAMKYESNWELSTARALAVLKLMQAAGLSPDILSAAGFGEFQPEAPNDTDDSKAQNRRIEITLVPNLNELPDLSELEKMLAE